MKKNVIVGMGEALWDVLPEEKKIAKITSVSVEEIFANAIKCIHDGTSISQLFD